MLGLLRRLLMSGLALALLAGCAAGPAEVAFDQDARAAADPSRAQGVTVTVHRTATCACCGVYEDVLEEAGFILEPVIHEQLRDVHARFGITLPGMPSGSPGMPGEQAEPFVVQAFVDGEVVGEFGRY